MQVRVTGVSHFLFIGSCELCSRHTAGAQRVVPSYRALQVSLDSGAVSGLECGKVPMSPRLRVGRTGPHTAAGTEFKGRPCSAACSPTPPRSLFLSVFRVPREEDSVRRTSLA